jgi:hypothetical protein
MEGNEQPNLEADYTEACAGMQDMDGVKSGLGRSICTETEGYSKMADGR